MNDEKKENSGGSETPEVFRIAQIPVGGPSMTRRNFIEGTIAAVGAGAMMTVLGGCEGGGGDDDGNGCVCNTVCPCEGVSACSCDTVHCQCQWGCECDTVGTEAATDACKCNTEYIKCKPSTGSTAYSTWVGVTCTCDTVTPCSCDAYVAPCSCDSHSDGGYYISYWYPN